MTNMLQSARPPALSLTHSSSFFFLPPSTLPQPYPSLHPYLTLYLPACLSRQAGHSAPPTFIHTTPCFVFVRVGWRTTEAAGWVAGSGSAGDGWKDDFTHSTTGLEEKRGGRSRRCSSLLEDHTCTEHPHFVIH